MDTNLTTLLQQLFTMLTGWRRVSYAYVLMLLCSLVVMPLTAKDPEIKQRDSRVSVSEPSFSFKLLLCDDDDNKAYWTDAPSLYIDGKQICTFKEVPTGNDGNYNVVKDYTGKDWLSYETSDYYVVLTDPEKELYESIDGLFIHYSSYYYYWVTVEILPKRIKAGHTYDVEFKGTWCTNNTGGSDVSVTKKFTVTANSDMFKDSQRSLSRPENGIMQYNQDALKSHTGHYYRFQFYSDGNYSKLAQKKSLPVDVFSTGTNIRWSVSNTQNYTYYLRQSLVNESAAYGKSGKKGAVEWYQDFGKISAEALCYPKSNSLIVDAGERWDKTVSLAWSVGETQSNTDPPGKWYVYRTVGNYKDGKPIDSASKTNVGTVKMTAGTDEYHYVDKSNSLEYNVDYTYEVVFIPDAWDVATTDKADGLNIYNTSPVMVNRGGELFKSYQVISRDDCVELKWETESFPTNNKYQFKVYRRKDIRVDNDTIPIYTMMITNGKEPEYNYIDKNLESVCDVYYYTVKVEALDTLFASEEKSGHLAQSSYVTDMTVSTGDYSDMVRVHWNAKQIGTDPTQYILYRRILGDKNTAWKKIYTTTGTDDAYSYEDMAVAPGEYYEYKVESNCTCEGVEIKPIRMTATGFSNSKGVVSGRITYGTGIGVKGVKVKAVPAMGNDSLSLATQIFSLKVNSVKGGVCFLLSDNEDDRKDQLANLHTDNDFSVQMWVNLHEDLTKPMWLDVYENFSLYGVPNEKGYEVKMRLPNDNKWTDYSTDITLLPNTFYNVTLTYSHKNKLWTLYVLHNGLIEKKEQVAGSVKIDRLKEKKRGVYFGTNVSQQEDYLFQGYIDELRWWSTTLSEQDILQNYDHLLDGSENGLAVYYPLDENIPQQVEAYDYSKSKLNGKILSDSKFSLITPRGKQFGLHTYTDADGNYTLSGIPFASNGTTYDIVPEMGIHEFSSKTESRYISSSSLVHNSVDFKDVSSFIVEGVVYYEGTLHPVVACGILIDGESQLYDSKPVMTDQEGRFTVSVPIGEHYISVEKEGHEFLNGGRYPAEGTHNFDREISGLKFTDTSKATVVGRVSAGPVQATLPIGFKEGKANIGKAIITLVPESDARMNVLEVTDELSSEVVNNPDSVGYVNPRIEYIESKAWVCGGETSDVKTIKIETDAKTGEFAALLPPVNYKVVSVEIPGYGDEDNFFKENLPRLDATARIEKEYKPTEKEEDTKDEEETGKEDVPQNVVLAGEETTGQEDEGTEQPQKEDEKEVEPFKYHASLILNHRGKPTLEITDKAHDDGAFGEAQVDVNQLDGSTKAEDVYSVIDNVVSYTYGYPILNSGSTYTYNLKAYEQYVNKDKDAGKDTVDVVLLDGVEVKITNNFAGGTHVVGANGGEAGEPGEIVKSAYAEVTLAEGTGEYKFVGNLPNIQGDHTLAMVATYDVDGVTYSWPDANEPFKVILLGTLPMGNNFVTKGPDVVKSVLRDPPGSNSYAMWEKGQVIEFEKTNKPKLMVEDVGITADVMTGWGKTVALGAPGAYTITDASYANNLTLGILADVEQIYDGNVKRSVETLLTSISTSSSSDFVGADGDVFLGESNNVVFGGARAVGLYEQVGTEPIVTTKDVIAMSEEFKTEFHYTQYYIKNTLLPNLEKLRNQVLLPKGTKVDEKKLKYAVFVSMVDESHPNYGTCNYDECWGNAKASKDATSGPSYVGYYPNDGKAYLDSVMMYNQEIETWKGHLSNNEQAKHKAINGGSDYKLEKNISFDGGVVYEDFYQYDDAMDNHSNYTLSEFNILAVGKLDFAWELGDVVGLTISPQIKIGGSGEWEELTITYDRLTTKYVLADSDNSDAYSVDVYKSPDNDGVIFYTRGGQTSCPYEGAVMSQYYKEGGKSVELGKATMQIEVPNINCDNPMQSGVPAGEKAYFELELQNNSAVDADVWYNLSVVEESNPHGAELLVDGLGVARTYLIPAGKSIKKTLSVKQGDPSVFDYKDIKIRLSSQCQGDPTAPHGEISDTISLSAYFVQTCSNIRLNVPNPVLNSATGTKLTMVVDDYNLNHDNLQGIMIEYQVQGDTDWTLLKKYVTDEKYAVQDEVVLKDAKINYTFDMGHLPDQNYVFRARTMCGGDLYNESEEVVVIKDMVKPALIGLPSPTDGIYNAGDELSIVFAEDVRSGEIKAENITVKAVLNETPVDHRVAFKSDGTGMAATDATFEAKGRSFAVGLWMKYSEPGTVVSHGTADNYMRVQVNEDHTLKIKIGQDNLISEEKLSPNTWTYLHVALQQAENAESVITAIAATDGKVLYLFDQNPCTEYAGNGRFGIGGTMVGAIHDVTFWNYARSTDEALNQMHATHAPQTMGLIGYWKLNEGNGTIAKDYARNRDMTLPSATAWYLNSENYALHLPENCLANVPLHGIRVMHSDDYLLEFWFKADQSQAKGAATLLSVGDSLLEVTLKESSVQMICGKKTKTIAIGRYFDNQWHHFALNVLNGTRGASTLYIDGNAVQQFAAQEIPALASDYLHLGAKGTINADGITTYSQYFPHAAFDEVRIWKGTYTAGFIREHMSKRVGSDTAGLMGYYPFERSELDQYNQPVIVATTLNQSENRVSDTEAVVGANASAIDEKEWTSATDVPALSVAPMLQNVPFSYTVSERKILIQPTADPRIMEGTTLTVAVKGVVDAYDNECEPVTWTAYVQQNPLVWSEDNYNVRLQSGEEHHFSLEINNVGTKTEYWTLSELPAWLEVDNEVGTLEPGEKKTLNFTVNDAIAVGRHEATIYLAGTDNVLTPLDLQVTIVGNEPNWNVNPADYSNSMMLIARLKIMGEFSENPDNIIAAFTDNEHCVGVGRLEYVKRYDAYYVMMNIYGEGDGYKLIFKAYDADRGVIHHSLMTQLNADDRAENTSIMFKSNDVVGSFASPVLFNATGHIEQSIPINKGWTWMSVNVKKPLDSSLATVLNPLGDKAVSIKSKMGHSDYTKEQGWVGQLTEIVPGNMYKLQTTDALTLPVTGLALPADSTPIVIEPGWNWIGYTPQASTSVANALANMNPQDGDIVKSQYAFAIFDDYQWEGTLKAMHPGEGYVIKSSASVTRQFHYPNVLLNNMQQRTRSLNVESGQRPVVMRYADNMNMIAVVKDGDIVLENAQIIAYVDGEERGFSETSLKDGKHFVTIQGEGSGDVLRFVVKIGEELFSIADPLYFSANSLCGSMSDPYVLQIDAALADSDIHLSRSGNLLTITAGAGLQSVKTYDAEGRVVHQEAESGQRCMFSVEHFTAGVYLVVVEDTAGKRRTFSIVR